MPSVRSNLAPPLPQTPSLFLKKSCALRIIKRPSLEKRFPSSATLRSGAMGRPPSPRPPPLFLKKKLRPEIKRPSLEKRFPSSASHRSGAIFHHSPPQTPPLVKKQASGLICNVHRLRKLRALPVIRQPLVGHQAVDDIFLSRLAC
jgi:hypothetical protein